MDGPSHTQRRLPPYRSDLKSLYNMAARLRKHPCRKTTEINFPNEGFPRSGEAVTAGD